MKKLVVFCAVCVLLAGVMSAQMTLGVKGGVGFTNVRDFMVAPEGGFEGISYPDQYYKNVFNFYIGATVELPVNDYLSIESGVFFAPRSGKLELDAKYYSGTSLVLNDRDVLKYDIKASYLEMPILLKFSVDKFSPYAGVSAGLLISNSMSAYMADYDYDVSGNEVDFEIDYDYSDVDIGECLKSFVMSAQFGLEYRITENISVDVRYVMGLTSLEKYYGLTDEEYTRISALPTAERQQWFREHPFLYSVGHDPDAEKNASIESASLYILFGYKFN